MGEAWVGWALRCAVFGSVILGAADSDAQSRFLSYSSEADCLAAHELAAPLCRSAFANARAEFEARTTSFPSMAQCAKSYRTCAPWPPGAPAKSSFRPRWAGVDIVDTPKEKSVTPATAAGVKTLSFAPQPLTEFRALDVRGTRPLSSFATRPPVRASSTIRSGEPASEAPSAPPPPGSGFKLEDGVLTYPAPSRFLPKNLPKQP